MTHRRQFLAAAGLASAAFATLSDDALARAGRAGDSAGAGSGHDFAANEDYWGEIQKCFDIDRTVINLNNGGVCPSPTQVMDQMVRDLKFTNESPVQHMWRVLQPRIEAVRRGIAREFGCDPEEIAITRNATESMETLINGIDLARGDEVIITDQNYPHMQTGWDQRARREGIVVRKLSFPVPLTDPSILVNKVREAITDKTRVVEIPQVTNWSGQVLPIRAITDLCREKNIEVFVDGAHGFAQFPLTRDDLGCDYYGVSLHKWLLAPIGTGFLYVRKEKIRKIWPLMSADAARDNDIRKFEEVGTHPAANFNAIAVALAFHRSIGTARKLARLRYLRDRWARPLMAADPRVKVWTPIGDEYAGGIALVQIEGVDSSTLFGHLWNQFQIVVSPTKHGQFQGIRISPNVYTTVDEIDTFVAAMRGVLAKGIPS